MEEALDANAIDQMTRNQQQQVAQAIADTPRITPEGFPLVGRTASFDVRYDVPGTSDELSCTLKASIPTFEQLQAIAFEEVKLCKGIPFENYPPDRQWFFRAVADLRVTLDPDTTPPWVLKWMVQDPELIDKIFSVVTYHRDIFFRAIRRSGDGTPQRPRLAITSALVDSVRNFQPAQTDKG